MVLSFFFNSRILQTGILQTGPNQFVENEKENKNQKQNQDNTGRFDMKNLPKRLKFFLPKRPVLGRFGKIPDVPAKDVSAKTWQRTFRQKNMPKRLRLNYLPKRFV